MTSPHPPNAFHTHLTFFSTTPTTASARSGRPSITLLSGLKQSLRLGLNFPLAVLTSLSLRILYGNPYALFLRPVDVRTVRTRRTMLEDVTVKSASGGMTRRDLMNATRAARKTYGDQVHVLGLWSICADADGLLGSKELDLCRKGELVWTIAERRKMRDREQGGVLPLVRGGPVSVAGHSWFVEKLFGVKVYQSVINHTS